MTFMLHHVDWLLPALPFITAGNITPPDGEGRLAFNFTREICTKRSELSLIMKMINMTASSLCNISNITLE